MDGSRANLRVVGGPALALSAARKGLSRSQAIVVCVLTISGLALSAWDMALAGTLLRYVLAASFAVIVSTRLAAVLLSVSPIAEARPLSGGELPHYTIVVALRDEAAIAAQLVARLTAIDYPPNKLTGWLVVEADDPVTRLALERAARPSWLRVLVAPPGTPMTKPRALNIALGLARPGLLTVYDAEDHPCPGQLREAAARFAGSDERLACLQAPLRIRNADRAMTWLERQFALEYAVLFEIMLPALARLGLPLPLGGTSNHFRVDVLRQVGGWDPWNVTEDADLGFRLYRLGYRCGVIRRPTLESPPPSVRVWVPQRTRWLKGFMQTLLVHTRRPQGLGARGLLTLLATLGASVASACFQALFVFWIAATLLVYGIAWTPPPLPVPDLSIAGYGWAIAGTCMALGAARASIRTGAFDILTAPIYWCLLSFAQAHALWRLAWQPFHWDKTPHTPDFSPQAISPACETVID